VDREPDRLVNPGSFVKTARRYRTIQIQAGPHTITAVDPIPDDLRQTLDAINGSRQLAH
jgi:hypothetical protein